MNPLQTPAPARSWDEYLTVIGGITFRPISCFTLSALYEMDSPLMFGGQVSATDFCAFAWLHAAPLSAVQASLAAKTWRADAMNWAATAPVEVFSQFTAPRLKQLAADVQAVFADNKTGFIPFLSPSPCRRSWIRRAFLSIFRR